MTKLVTALAACVIAFAVAAPTAAQQTTTPTLYKRLGGYDAIAAVTDDFVGRLASDPGLSRFFIDYLGAGVLQPLGMQAELRGSPAADLHGSLDDLVILARELQRPTLVAPETLAEATTVQFPGLAGVLPDFGRFDPNDWGLGFELRDEKSPHWTGTRNSPRTFGHFGGSGTFLWVDPDAGVALGVLTNLDFGEWAKEAWPRLSDSVLIA